MAKYTFWEITAIVSQIVAYIIAAVVIVQLLRMIFGGSWQVEDIILTLLSINITITVGIVGYLVALHSKISHVDTKMERHLGWHKGVSDRRKT